MSTVRLVFLGLSLLITAAGVATKVSRCSGAEERRRPLSEQVAEVEQRFAARGSAPARWTGEAYPIRGYVAMESGFPRWGIRVATDRGQSAWTDAQGHFAFLEPVASIAEVSVAPVIALQGRHPPRIRATYASVDTRLRLEPRTTLFLLRDPVKRALETADLVVAPSDRQYVGRGVLDDRARTSLVTGAGAGKDFDVYACERGSGWVALSEHVQTGAGSTLLFRESVTLTVDLAPRSPIRFEYVTCTCRLRGISLEARGDGAARVIEGLPYGSQWTLEVTWPDASGHRETSRAFRAGDRERVVVRLE